MIKCICINDLNKPFQIPEDKWVKKDQSYHVIYTIWSITSQKVGVYLDEISLDDSCLPYEYFDINRFAFNINDIGKLHQLIKDCSDTDFSMDELMESTNKTEKI